MKQMAGDNIRSWSWFVGVVFRGPSPPPRDNFFWGEGGGYGGKPSKGLGGSPEWGLPAGPVIAVCHTPTAAAETPLVRSATERRHCLTYTTVDSPRAPYGPSQRRRRPKKAPLTVDTWTVPQRRPCLVPSPCDTA